MKNIAPYGHWQSPISAKMLTQNTLRLSEPHIVGEDYYWLESRPEEMGRSVLVRQCPGKPPQDLLAQDVSVITHAHEYGGASYIVANQTVFAVFDSDQRLYKIPLENNNPGIPIPLTPEGEYRYANFCWDKTHQRLIAVRENHNNVNRERGEQERNEIISINLNPPYNIQVLVSGADFYSNPQVSPDGKKLCWLSWNHPQMPWDGTHCSLGEIHEDGNIRNVIVVAGGKNESIFQPQWNPNGTLYFVSDKTDWWNLYSYNLKDNRTEPVISMDAEFATPQWVFGMSSYSFFDAENILCCYTKNGQWQLAHVHLKNKPSLTPIHSALTDISSISCNAHGALFLGASTTQAEALYFSDPLNAQPKLTCIISSQPDSTIGEYLSKPKDICFTTSDRQQAYGFYYAPKNPDYAAPKDTLPPLIVICHGGPTGSTSASLNNKIQYWTTRGFAIFDINYRGSTGFGRKYRDSLKNNWGITDIIDMVSGAEYLVQQKLADPAKLIIRGSSAGGYTVLAALTFSNTFSAGASLYGIGDLEALAQDTHKFESHYLDSLVGPYPAQKNRYRERSPINHIEQLTCPVIFFQGLKDKVVPPAQAEAMVAALTKKGIENRYITFKNEAHGFRQANNIETVYIRELEFYQDVLPL